MKTVELVQLIRTEAPDVPELRILMYLDAAQKTMLNHDCNAFYAIDPATGTYPVLTTTAGEREYQISTDNGFPFDAWRVISVFSGDDKYSPAECVFSEDTGNGATITFSSDPSGSVFKVLYIKQPPTLLTVRTALQVPSSEHLLLKRITMLLLEEAEHGSPSQDLELIRRRELPKFWGRMNDNIGNPSQAEAYV